MRQTAGEVHPPRVAMEAKLVSEYILEMLNIHKEFPGVKALKGVELKVRPGTVHALMGENGAGKSTLMKCLNGIYHMEQGEIILRGESVKIKSPIDAAHKGISMIHQELNPIPKRPISDNLWVGREPKKMGVLDKKKMYQDSIELFERIGVQLDPNMMMGELSVSQMQMVEIAKAVSHDADIVVMDEPTSSLTEGETEHLFKVIAQLKAQGKGIIYISHKLDEIFQICDEVTVFRDGEYIAHNEIKNITADDLIYQMVGREVDNIFPKVDCPIGDVILKVENLSAGKAFQNVSFELRRGEILGLAGLVGAGRTEIAETIFGMRQKTSGKIYKDGVEVHIKSPADAIKAGIGLLTEDRRKSGIVPVLSILHNISIAKLPNYVTKFGTLRKQEMKKDATEYGKKLRIKAPNFNTLIRDLSGGNQQKVLVSRWLLTHPDILIVDEPTRGIDVGAKSEIHQILTNLAGEGKAIIMISSEMPEVMGMSDRIIVMHEGTMTGVIDRKDFDQEHILACASADTGTNEKGE